MSYLHWLENIQCSYTLFILSFIHFLVSFLFLFVVDPRAEGKAWTPAVVCREMYFCQPGNTRTNTQAAIFKAMEKKAKRKVKSAATKIPAKIYIYCCICVHRWRPWSRWWTWQPSCLSVTEMRCTVTSSVSAVSLSITYVFDPTINPSLLCCCHLLVCSGCTVVLLQAVCVCECVCACV